MARKYKSNKVTNLKPKNIQEKQNTRIESSNFLPGVFQTDLNKRRLGATLDNMLSKGTLERVEGYIGSTNSLYRNSKDFYAQLPPLIPAVIHETSDGEVMDIVTPSEVALGHEESFSSYNTNGAYNSLAYVFAPPINPDKFLNHLQYFWCPDLPVDTWENNTGENIDPVTESKGLPFYTITLNDGTSFEFENGLRVKFKGDSFHSDIIGNVYLITGVGTSIDLKLMEEIIKTPGPNFGKKKKVFTDRVPYTNLIGGNWGSPVNAIHNGNGVNDYEAETNFQNLLVDYNNDPNRLPRLKLYVESLQRGEHVYNNMPVRLGNGWDVTNDNTVYLLELDDTGKIITPAKILVNPDATINTAITDYEQLKIAKEVLEHWDIKPWDYKELPLDTRDYHVIDTSDPLSTAWSRANHWVHKRVLLGLKNKQILDFDYQEFTSADRQAIRPIIEFNAGLQLFDSPTTNSDDLIFGGIIDAIVENEDDALNLFEGNENLPDARYYVLNTNILKTTGGETITLDSNKTYIFTVFSDLVDGTNYYGKDVVYSNGNIEIIQPKLAPNQAPLFELYEADGSALRDLPNNNFTGNKIFGYNVGTGKIDPELGFALTYKDGPKGADYEFKNYLSNTAYTYRSDATEYTETYDMPLYYKQWGTIEENYVPTHYSMGAKSYQQYRVNELPTVTIADIDYKEISVGRSAWEVDKEFLVGYVGGSLTVSEVLTEGVYNRTREQQPTLVLAKDTTYTFHDLTPDQELLFWDPEGNEIDESHPTVGFEIDGKNINITMPDTVNYIIRYGIILSDSGTIITNASEDEFYHDLILDGLKLKYDEYTIEQNRILLPESRILPTNEFLDLEYYGRSDENINTAEVNKYNSKNQRIDTFTITETLNHWISIIEHTPNIQGDYWGDNTFHKSLRLDNHGGELFVHDDLGIMYNSQYGNSQYDVSRGIINQAKEWWAFKNRIASNVKKLYKTRIFESVKELTDLAITQVSNLKYHNGLHADSNMLFVTGNKITEYELEELQTQVNIGISIQSDRVIKDHLYVYLTENMNSDDVMIERLLVENVDYTINGSVLTLSQPGTPSSFRPAELRMYFHAYTENSNVPASLAKLGMQSLMRPTVETSRIICHDSDILNISNTAELYNPADANFDPVAAVMLDMENRIYNGLVQEEIRFNNSAYKYMPSQHRGTWYTLEHLNEGCEKYFVEWYNKQGFESLTPEDYYQVDDDTTWNYSSIDFGEHLFSSIPGHWVGAYTVLFGTHRPDLTPWRMLGFATKPTWWDNHYPSPDISGSWADSAKRTALHSALIYGLISEPGQDKKQDFYYSRYYWDFDASPLVDTSGNLVDRSTVLGTPSPDDAAREFVYGDWGPIEQQWRFSPLGQSALLATIIKLNPTKTWTEFFQTNTYYRTYTGGDRTVNRYTGKLFAPEDIILNGETDTGLSIKSIEIVSAGSGFPSDTTAIVYGADNKIAAQIQANIVSNELESFTITNAGWGYDRIPFIKLIGTGTLPDYEVIAHMETKKFHSFGINYTQANELKRNNQSVDLLIERYRNLVVKKVQLLNGFTKNSLISLSTETGLQGPGFLIENERPVFLHVAPAEKLTASTITIEKTDSGYKIFGYGINKQEFEFFEPNLDSNATIVPLNSDTTVKKYTKYNTVVPSILKYNAKLARIQDVYNFIIGYYMRLESQGWSFEIDKEAQALIFAKWALISDIGETYSVKIGPIVSFTSDYGSPAKINSQFDNDSVIVDMQRSAIDSGDLEIIRDFQSFKITSPTSINIGSYNIIIYTWEHALVLANIGNFGEDLYDDVLRTEQARFLIELEKTSDWNGTLQAPGYFVDGNSIRENFDTSVDNINYHYDLDVVKDNPIIELTEQRTVNNVGRDWINSLGLPANVISKFYQGAIKQAGSRNAIGKLASVNLVNQFDSTDVEVREEWMFKHSYFGNTDDLKNTEVVINKNNIVGDSLLVDFTDTNLVYVNDQKEQQFVLEDIDGTPIFSAGDLLPEEATYLIKEVNELETVFDDSAEYANILTWNGQTSYKKNDLVRHQGHLYECAVDFIGYNIVSSDFNIIGTETNPVFPFGTPAEIDGNTILLEATLQVFNDIVIQSVENPAVQSPSELFINGTRISIQKTGEQTVIDEDEIYNGNPFAITNSQASYDVTDADPLIVNLGTDTDNQDVSINLTPYATETEGTPTLPPATVSYTNVNQSGSSGTGLGAVIDVTRSNSDGSYTIALVNAGLGYAIDDTVTFSGTLFGGTSPANDIVLTVTAVQTIAGEIDTYTEAGSGIVDLPTPGASVFTLTQAQLIQAINAYQDLTAQPHILDNSKIAMIYEVNGAINKRMIVRPNSTATLLGIADATYPPATIVQPAPEVTDAVFISNLINNAGISNISSKVLNNRIVVTQQANASSQASDVLTISGQANTVLQFPAATQITSSPTNTVATLEDAVDAINNAGISGVTAVAESSLLKINSTNESITLGDTAFTDIAGFQPGIVYRQNVTVDNEFIESQWNEIDEQDTALFNIWMLSDTGLENGSINGIDTKFNSWNVLQVQNLGLYSEDEESCSICAGTATSDGNDAQVTVNIDISNLLQVGDYVMLVNTTTQPAINGIHKITRLGTVAEPKTFYIDRFIEKCGTASQIFVLRNSRFKSISDIQNAMTSAYYDWSEGMRVWSTENNPSPTATRVFDYTNGNFIEDFARAKTQRITNTSIDNVRIYDGETQTASIEIEVFDPLRGIIPGVADREIDITNSNDIAAYNTSTDSDFNTVARGAWQDEYVGTVWWDTSTVKYYDYDQGTVQDRLKNWAKQVPGSSIDVYEWTKSDIPPDEWADAVTAQKEVMGTVATGQAFSRFDATLNEDVYYYTESEEYNNTTKLYNTTYYFWIKNKESRPASRMYNTRQLAAILRNPQSMGISWCAAISENAMIVNGLTNFVNPDNTSVLQVNTSNGVMHSRWTAIEEGRGIIPDYWHVGLQDNLAGVQRSTGIRLPNPELNEYNRYGDDRSIKFGNQTLSQAWYKQLPLARAEAVDVINRLLKSQNTLDNLPATWNRTITQVITTEGTVNTDLDQQEPQIVTVDLNKMWELTSFVREDWDDTRQHSFQVSNFDQLELVDTQKHTIVLVDKSGNIGELDKSEIWSYEYGEWTLVKKMNATIEFDKFFLTQQIGWDTRPYDNVEWDFDISEYVYNMIKACREDLFIDNFKDKYNEMFFTMIKYAIASHPQVDWVYKTTYINMYLSTPIELQQKVYKRDLTNEVIGYVNSVKPFHTKIRQVFDDRNIMSNILVTFNDIHKIETTMRFNQDGNEIVADPNMEYIASAFTDVLGSADIYDAGSFTETQTDTLGDLGFAEKYVTNTQDVTAYTGKKWSLVDGTPVNRLHHVDLTVRDSLKIAVTTTLFSDTAKYIYLQDHYGNVTAYFDDNGTLLPIDTPVNVVHNNSSTGWDVDSGLSMLDPNALDTESKQIQNYLQT